MDVRQTEAESTHVTPDGVAVRQGRVEAAEAGALGRFGRRLAAGIHNKEGIVAALLYLALGALFGMTPVAASAVPLGLALLSAVRQKHLVPTVLGLALGSVMLGGAGLVYLAVYGVAVGLRALLSIPGEGRKILPDSRGFFCEAKELRVAVACFCGILAAGYQFLAGGFTTEGILFGASMLLFGAGGSWLLCGVTEGGVSLDLLAGKASLPHDRWARVHLRLGALALSAAVALVLSPLSVFGVSLSYLFITLATLYVAKRTDALHALVLGAVSAAAVGVTYAPGFALLGLLSGVLWPLGIFFAVGLGVASVAVWSSLVGGLGGFLTVFSATLVGGVCAVPLLRVVGDRTRSVVAEEGRDLRSYKQAAVEPAEARLTRLSSAFGSLSRLLSDLRVRESTPDGETCRAICAKACAVRCGACEHYALCWEGEATAAARLVEAAGARVEAGEPVDGALILESVGDYCPHAEPLAEDIGTAVGAYLQEQAGTDLAETVDFDTVGALLRDAVRTERAESREDGKLAETVRECLREAGMSPREVLAWGYTRRHLLALMDKPAPVGAEAEALRRSLERATGLCLSSPTYRTVSEGTLLATSSVESLTVSCATAERCAPEESVSGDSVRAFRTPEGRYCAVLSDGMGSGRGAAACSGICTATVERMLSAGGTKSTALRMLNHLYRAEGKERSATVDLFELDLFRGEATFLKAGAAPSYVKRGTELFRVRTKTIPLGLLQNPDTERIRFTVKAGDTVILLSDGISQTPEDAPWLQKLLAEEGSDADGQALAARILSAACEHGGRADDMTVAVLSVRSA